MLTLDMSFSWISLLLLHSPFTLSPNWYLCLWHFSFTEIQALGTGISLSEVERGVFVRPRLIRQIVWFIYTLGYFIHILAPIFLPVGGLKVIVGYQSWDWARILPKINSRSWRGCWLNAPSFVTLVSLHRPFDGCVHAPGAPKNLFL